MLFNGSLSISVGVVGGPIFGLILTLRIIRGLFPSEFGDVLSCESPLTTIGGLTTGGVAGIGGGGDVGVDWAIGTVGIVVVDASV